MNDTEKLAVARLLMALDEARKPVRFTLPLSPAMPDPASVIAPIHQERERELAAAILAVRALIGASPTPVTLRDDLRQMSADFRKLDANPGAWLMHEFVLREGIDCTAQPLPPRYRKRWPKQCFANTASLLRRTKLTYVEGFVSAPRVPFPIHHAWAINAIGEVIDTTISDPHLCVYVGVPFTREEYVTCTRDRSASVMLDEIGCVRVACLLARCPALRELMPTKS
jgi:hypothetical protein